MILLFIPPLNALWKDRVTTLREQVNRAEACLKQIVWPRIAKEKVYVSSSEELMEISRINANCNLKEENNKENDRE